jgi:crotonobetainyl-CoA:carnitine CoA-transferase CaiB-like acyl-CoA transferase
MKGPDSELPAYDYCTQARSGMMSIASDPDGPPKLVPGYIGDTMGAIMTSYGILAALVARDQLGIGQQIEASAIGSLAFLESLNITAYMHFGQQLPKYEREKAPMPLWNHYMCSDNKWIAIALIQSDKYWHEFCEVLDIGFFENDPQFETERKREENSQRLISLLDKIFITRSRKDWLKRFREKGDFVIAPVNTLEDLIADPQMLENNYILKYEHPDLGSIKMVGFPVRMKKTPVSPTGSAPHIGEHTYEVLSEIAEYTEEEIKDLREQEII